MNKNKLQTHGADIDIMCRKYGKNRDEIIDFSSNINQSMPKKLKEKIIESIDYLSEYPDIEYVNLKNVIANYLNTSEEYIMVGNGASELIHLFMKGFKGSVSIFAPTFTEYERAATLYNHKVENHSLYNLDEKFAEIEANCSKIDSVKTEKIEYLNSLNLGDIVFICNPNNPDGGTRNIETLVDFVNTTNKILLVDETFMEFSYKACSLISKLENNKNIVLIKAVTKFFGVPGIRLGYILTSNKSILENMKKYKEPWSVNTFAEKTAEIMFNDKTYIKQSKMFYETERQYIYSQLKQLEETKKIKLFKSDINCIFMQILDGKNAQKVKEILFNDYNILVRNTASFKMLKGENIRFAVKKHDQNEKLVKSLNCIFK